MKERPPQFFYATKAVAKRKSEKKFCLERDSSIFKNKGNVVWTLNESLNRFKFQHAFNKLSTFFTLSTMLNDLFKRPRHLVQQSVECMLKQILKPFKRAFNYISFVCLLGFFFFFLSFFFLCLAIVCYCSVM